MTTVWVRRIDGRHDSDTEVHASERSAKLSLLEYVNFNWLNEMRDKPRPADNQAAIELYFDTVWDELAEITEHEVIQ